MPGQGDRFRGGESARLRYDGQPPVHLGEDLLDDETPFVARKARELTRAPAGDDARYAMVDLMPDRVAQRAYVDPPVGVERRRKCGEDTSELSRPQRSSSLFPWAA